jgi:hypothetical protein
VRAKWVEGLSTRLVKVLEMMEVVSKDDALRRWYEGDFDNKRGFGLKTRAELREWLGLPDQDLWLQKRQQREERYQVWLKFAEREEREMRACIIKRNKGDSAVEE